MRLFRHFEDQGTLPHHRNQVLFDLKYFTTAIPAFSKNYVALTVRERL